MAEISCEMKHKDFYVDTERRDKKSILFITRKSFFLLALIIAVRVIIVNISTGASVVGTLS